MHSLRRAHLLARFVLVWFALSIGVAIAAPIINPQTMQLICSGAGVMKVLVQNDDGSEELPGQMLHCPLCANISAPPPVACQDIVLQQPLAYALQPIPAAHVAARTASPLPARGPPAIL